jgi:hypothetical protein
MDEYIQDIKLYKESVKNSLQNCDVEVWVLHLSALMMLWGKWTIQSRHLWYEVEVQRFLWLY